MFLYLVSLSAWAPSYSKASRKIKFEYPALLFTNHALSLWVHRSAKFTLMATTFITVHRSNFSVPKLSSKEYMKEQQCTLKGELCTESLELTNHIAPRSSHDFIETDDLSCVHAGVI